MGLEERKQSRQIDGLTYEVTPLGLQLGLDALDRFAKVMSGPISEVIEKEGDEAEMTAALLRALPTVLSSSDVKYFVKTFGPNCTMQAAKGMVPMTETNIELHFAGRYSALFKWLAFNVEVNFGGFFGDLLQGKLLSGASLGAMQQS